MESRRPTAEEWKDAIAMLLEVQRTLADSVVSGHVEEYDRRIVGLPSGVVDAMPGGARVEAALHAVFIARLLLQQAVDGFHAPGVLMLERAQQHFAIAGGYVAATVATELSERVDSRRR
jgi:hypothetical protein